jgi:hypothetical protein
MANILTDTDSEDGAFQTWNVDGYCSDTDNEDGATEHIALIQANMQLIIFLKRQSLTIARIRHRILGLRGRITELTLRLENPT